MDESDASVLGISNNELVGYWVARYSTRIPKDMGMVWQAYQKGFLLFWQVFEIFKRLWLELRKMIRLENWSHFLCFASARRQTYSILYPKKRKTVVFQVHSAAFTSGSMWMFLAFQERSVQCVFWTFHTSEMNLHATTKQPTGRPIYWSWQAYGRFFRRDYDLLEVELNPYFFRRIISWTSGQKTARRSRKHDVPNGGEK